MGKYKKQRGNQIAYSRMGIGFYASGTIASPEAFDPAPLCFSLFSLFLSLLSVFGGGDLKLIGERRYIMQYITCSALPHMNRHHAFFMYGTNYGTHTPMVPVVHGWVCWAIPRFHTNNRICLLVSKQINESAIEKISSITQF